MSFFKKIGRSISSAFKKAPSVISNIFKKGEGVASQVAGGLSKVADVIGSVASNPLVEAGASAIFGPEAGIALNEAGNFANMLKSGSGLAKTVGQTSGAISRGDLGGGLAGIQRISQQAKDVGGVSTPSFSFQ